ncbi:hypothetical protein [Pseudophaeobacter sp. EL27]|uniref:hypothetical protein n=1 Tax=Pseudophaeobacter sp. EL27 TaxID=2107580 RepID=UPI0013C42C32|nr:hypothetical protein [Pseudophaeobacter sp. EL27]
MPRTEGELARAIVAEAQGRACANARLATLAEILVKPELGPNLELGLPVGGN